MRYSHSDHPSLSSKVTSAAADGEGKGNRRSDPVSAKRSCRPDSTPSEATGEAPPLSRKRKSKTMLGRDRNAHGAGEASADAGKGRDMLMEDKVHSTLLSVHCFGDDNIDEADGAEPANEVDPPTMDSDIELVGGAQGSFVTKHEHTFAVDNCHDVNMCMDKSIPLASQNCLRSEESARTQEMKPNIPSLAMEIKDPLDHREKPATPDTLELNICDVSEENMRYLFTFRPAADYVEDFSPYDEQELTNMHRRLALSRIKDYKLLSTGEKLDIAEVAAQYPPDVLQTQGYFDTMRTVWNGTSTRHTLGLLAWMTANV
ncbi:uncharacterized protein LOC104581860 isoform X1 [Brachypodium distachyon]|uniref:uncharacterized protein LOC104581860 isoform X1 n=1 Tax=Brachypodium distachyon TaxID=15368 RepID=UPI00052FE27B|nr:uncharacterized protein LOC104581860 isoform X1 [Brachypodium distachyon]|eukprot:XP_010229106.1 uncharacterized protein LOC104581860 isoform X1 [Brachypodium distachyon]